MKNFLRSSHFYKGVFQVVHNLWDKQVLKSDKKWENTSQNPVSSVDETASNHNANQSPRLPYNNSPREFPVDISTIFNSISLPSQNTFNFAGELEQFGSENEKREFILLW